jgi:hypothetical protein
MNVPTQSFNQLLPFKTEQKIFKPRTKIIQALQDDARIFQGRTRRRGSSGCSRPSSVCEPRRGSGWPMRSGGWPNYAVPRARSDLTKRLDAEVQRVTSLAKADYERQKARSGLVKASELTGLVKASELRQVSRVRKR